MKYCNDDNALASHAKVDRVGEVAHANALDVRELAPVPVRRLAGEAQGLIYGVYKSLAKPIACRLISRRRVLELKSCRKAKSRRKAHRFKTASAEAFTSLQATVELG